MTPSQTNYSTRKTVSRFLKKKAAMAGAVVILFSFIVALIGYLIAPDHTPNANRMIVEIGGKKPGYTQQFIIIPSKEIKNEIGVLEWFYGTLSNDIWIPIQSYHMASEKIFFQRYIDEDVTIADSIPIRSLQKNSQSKVDVTSFILTKTFFLGTDKFGRDILSRLIIGTRVSLSVGIVTVLLSISVGVWLGAMAGYFGGKIDALIMWFINVLWSIPTILLVFAITLLLGKGFWQVLIAIGLTMWVNVARLIRGQVMSIKTLDYIEAARVLGFKSPRIIFKHILPNVMGPVIVIAASNFASAILLEAGLSFLGIGVQAPQPSWGLMIKENFNFIITHNPMLALAPGIAIMLLVLAFNLVGNGLRDAMNLDR